MMTFGEAKTRLKGLAGGRYHTIGFSLTEFSSGDVKATCSVYIDGGSHHEGPTWEAAFRSLCGCYGTKENDATEMAPAEEDQRLAA